MLKELYIKNYALIKELTVRFSKNLTVLSGETGAGKSIIVGALGLVLGEKAKTSQIRSGAKNCTVEGRLEMRQAHPVYSILGEKGIPSDRAEGIIIRRTITQSGISKSYINGLQVAVKDLKDITGTLIDIHGQHEHQSLLNVKNHLFLLDQYGKHQDKLGAYKKSYDKLLHFKGEIERHTIDKRERERRIDILEHALAEIDRAELKENELEELEEEYKILRNYEKLVNAVNNTYNFLNLDEDSATSMIDSALSQLYKVSEYMEEVGRVVEELEASRGVIAEIASNLKGYIDGIEYDPGRIDTIQARIELIKNMKKKYGDTIKEIKEYRDRCARELEDLQMSEDIINDLNEKLKRETEYASKLAKELSIQRRVSAQTLRDSIMSELSYLSMDKAQFKVNIVYLESPDGPVEIEGKRYELTKSGLDSCEFLLSANQGEPFMPLKNIASGGELSRIMLAIKTVLGGVDPILTFVFDEIDAGIGGKVSWAVGKRLKELSRFKQILCITHQAQIASKGDLNIRVDKVQRDGRSITEVKRLAGEQRIAEIARMISGKRISEAALRQAREMISE
ncbi:MAG: DNA repair protein RecN [Spirochaetota bacterium]|nr:MAG: DNA repair protein RecN [Spirochaetota bacterium]